MTLRLRHLMVGVFLVGVALAICAQTHHAVPSSSTSTLRQNNAFSQSGTCHSTNDLPDATCTPGTADPRVTQDNIQTTICQSGYSATVRPSTSVTNPIKTERMTAYGATGTKADYELDHLISLELGGAPADPKNLWPEPYAGSEGARVKDKVENQLHALVCRGVVSLTEAQQAIAKDWKQAYVTYGAK